MLIAGETLGDEYVSYSFLTMRANGVGSYYVEMVPSMQD